MHAAFRVEKHLKSMANSTIISEDNSKEASTQGNRIRVLQAQIEDLKKRWPAHSVPASMLQRLDELEEELENELRSSQGGG